MLPGIKQFDLAGRSAIMTGGSKGLGEAMAAGLPVIATTAGALPEIVENDHTGILVSIKNPSHLGDAIIKLLTQSWLRPKLSQSGCNAVRQKYSWNHTANTLATFYAKHD